MDELFTALENRIRSLMQKLEQSQQTNSALKQGKSELAREKQILLTRHKNSIKQIEEMISRLKSIENPS